MSKSLKLNARKSRVDTIKDLKLRASRLNFKRNTYADEPSSPQTNSPKTSFPDKPAVVNVIKTASLTITGPSTSPVPGPSDNGKMGGDKGDPHVEGSSAELLITSSTSSLVNPASATELSIDNDHNEQNAAVFTSKERVTREARAKSVFLSCYSGLDMAYCILRVLFFFGLNIIPDAFSVSHFRIWETSCQNSHEEIWVGSFAWFIYFLSDIVLILGVIRLNLKFCYAYITLKTTSVILNFLELFIYGFRCNSTALIVEVSLFFLIHIPIQIFGAKLCRVLIRTLRRFQNDTRNLPPQPHCSSPSSNHKTRSQKDFESKSIERSPSRTSRKLYVVS